MDRGWTELAELPAAPSVVTVGVFDGVHRGHQVIVGHAVGLARRLGVRAVALTFDPHPVTVLRPGHRVPLLTTVPRRAQLLKECGVDEVVVLSFTEELSRLQPREFVDSVLRGALAATAVVVGSNFRFGHRAAGDLDTLTEIGAAVGFAVEGVPLVGTSGGTFSSSYVRERVLAGQVEEAALALGRPHRLDGVVVTGDRRGRALGYPTANVSAAEAAAVPADGVYAGRLVRGSDAWPAAISVGTNPTFSGSTRRVEAHALDVDVDLYDSQVGVEFLARIRDTWKFDSAEALVAQMDEDVVAVRRLLADR